MWNMFRVFSATARSAAPHGQSRPLVLGHRGAVGRRARRTRSTPSRGPAKWAPTASSSTCAAPPTASSSCTTTRAADVGPARRARRSPTIRAAPARAADAGRSARRVRGMAGERRGQVLPWEPDADPANAVVRAAVDHRAGAATRRRALVVRPRRRRRGARRTRPTCRPAGSRTGSPIVEPRRAAAAATVTWLHPDRRAGARRRRTRSRHAHDATACTSTCGPSTTPTRCRRSPPPASTRHHERARLSRSHALAARLAA